MPSCECLANGVSACASAFTNAGCDSHGRYDLFVARMRKNVHLVLCMSPAGDNFRSRLRKYPALVSAGGNQCG